VPELYERLTGTHPTLPKVPTDTLLGAIALVVGGDATVAEANAIIADASGEPLGATGIQEASDLAALVTSINVPAVPSLPAPPGTINAANAVTYATAVRNYSQQYSQRAEALALRSQVMHDLRRVIMTAETSVPSSVHTGVPLPPLASAADVRTVLGVPTRA
jgi:hypothetical protein